MRSVIFVPSAAAWDARSGPGGLSLLERQWRQLRALGLDPPVLLLATAESPPLAPERVPAAVVRVPGAADVLAALSAARAALPAEFVFLTADRLVDLRVLRALAAGAGPRLACGADGRPEGVGRARTADLESGGARAAPADRLTLDALDPYVPELRGRAAPYLFAVRTAAERAWAWRVLLDHAQKRTLDLPGQYFDSPFENALVRALAPTPVTPNQITVATLVLALAVGLLFLGGWLRAGVLLALVVGILDGVDGKLARIKLATSRLGELEHVGDFLYENFWYLALGVHLRAATGAAAYWWTAVLLVACDLADSLLYALVRRRTGRMLDEIAPFDRAFRRVAGRRNVYVWILVAGFFTGHAAGALVAAALWAACTVAVHAVRALAAPAAAGR